MSEFMKDTNETTNEAPKEERKLFANKKANIAFIVAGVVIVLAIIGLAIFAYS